MAFSTLPPGSITSGNPVTQELWTKTKDNFDDHETRLNDVEAQTSVQQPFQFIGLGSGYVGDDVGGRIVAPYNFTLTGIRLTVFRDGTAGTMTVDVQLDSGGGFSSLMTGTISLAFGGGDGAQANAPGLTGTSFNSGDILRLDIDSVQTGSSGYIVEIQHEVSA